MTNVSLESDHRPMLQATPGAARGGVEAALRESEARFRAVWEATSEALALSDPAGIVLAVNPAYCALYGRPPEELIGQSFALIFPEAERAAAVEQYHAVFADPAPPRATRPGSNGRMGASGSSRPGRTSSSATGRAWR